jgi:hypothetical protein
MVNSFFCYFLLHEEVLNIDVLAFAMKLWVVTYPVGKTLTNILAQVAFSSVFIQEFKDKLHPRKNIRKT